MRENMVKFNKDIGVFTINRPRSSCLFATDFCRERCYHGKFEKLYAIHREKLEADEEQFWKELTGRQLWGHLEDQGQEYQPAPSHEQR